MKFLRDLFMSPGNKAWDLARITGMQAFAAYTFAFLYALLWKGETPDWNSLGIGYTAVLGGTALLIGVKDAMRARFPDAVPEAPPPEG
jgi:hypothetical protein